MPRIFVSALALVGLVAATSACSTTVAAVTVGSSTVSQATLVDLAKAYQLSPLVSGSPAPAGRSAPTSVPTQVTAKIVESEIVILLAERILASRHATVTSLERQLVLQQLSTQARNQPLAQVIRPLLERFLVKLDSATVALEASLQGLDLSDHGLRAYALSHGSAFENVCLDIAVYSSQTDAQAARSAIAGGTPFVQAEASALQSTGTSSQCFSLGSVPPPIQLAIAATPVGQVGPVQSSGTGASRGYLVFQVVSVTPVNPASLNLAQVAQQVIQGADPTQSQKSVTDALRREAGGNTITVNPADGVLTQDAGQAIGFSVSPPGRPPAAALPTTTSTSTPLVP